MKLDSFTTTSALQGPQVRVIGFAAGQPVGEFSDALTVVVP
jgi:hypothetical protein